MQTKKIELKIERKDATETRTFQVASVAGARFASRDVDGMRKQLDEMLATDGYYTGATRTNPSIYRIGRYLLTQDSSFEVQGALTGGEVEVVAIRSGDEVFITVGSDQCDRELDRIFPDKPKQMCPHPIASTAWPYEEVRQHWDDLRISSEVILSGHTIRLQQSSLSELVDLDTMFEVDTVKGLAEPLVLFCGSVPALESAAQQVRETGLPDEVLHGVCDEFHMRISDPVLDRRIELRYRAVPLGDDLHDRRSPDGPIVYHPSQ